MARKQIAVDRSGLGLKTPWPEIRSLVELGIPMVQVAKSYHVDISTISHRKKLEGWSTPKAVSERARQLLAEEMGDPDSSNPLLDRRARELIDRHMSLREVAHSAALEGLKRFKTTKRTPGTFFEAESLLRMADKAAGIDSTNSHGPNQGSHESHNTGGARCAVNITFLNPLPPSSHTPAAQSVVDITPLPTLP